MGNKNGGATAAPRKGSQNELQKSLAALEEARDLRRYDDSTQSRHRRIRPSLHLQQRSLSNMKYSEGWARFDRLSGCFGWPLDHNNLYPGLTNPVSPKLPLGLAPKPSDYFTYSVTY